MPSSYSPDLRIELIANGEQSGTWGTTTNVNLGTLIEDAIAGLASVSVTTANQALTAVNGGADQARCAAVSLTTTTAAAFNVYVPPVPKLYVINNASAYAATIFCSTVLGNTTAAGTGVAVPANRSVLLRSDGTNIVEQLNHVVGNFGVSGTATIATASITTATVTGTTTLQNALVLGGAPGTAGQVVVSQGAGAAPAWGNAFIPGMIMMWSGTIATIPSGWALCNGSSGTPDLRNRFIVGASVDSGGQSVTTITGGNTKTGGSKDAIVVSHNHTATTTASDSGHIHAVPESVQLLNSGNGFATGVTPTARSVNSQTGFANISASTTIGTTGSSGTDANLVPYFALAFIMKL
jgi:microcystin-dependent protein